MIIEKAEVDERFPFEKASQAQVRIGSGTDCSANVSSIRSYREDLPSPLPNASNRRHMSREADRLVVLANPAPAGKEHQG